jgi:hypothetical protein
MAKQPSKPRAKRAKSSPQKEVPPGATRKAWDRSLDHGGGAPGSAAGPRHASDDEGSENEAFGRMDRTWTPASPPLDEEEPLESGPPYAGLSGGAVGGTPAQLRSSEGPPHQSADLEEGIRSQPPPVHEQPTSVAAEATIRLTGYEAIEYAEKQGLLLNKHPDSLTGPRIGLHVAEAEGIADDDPDLIWLDVAQEDYYSSPPTNFEPDY